MNWVALLAAFGLGTVAAALIARGVAIAQLRQAWINALRDDMAKVLSTSDRIAKLVRDSSSEKREELDEQSHKSMAAHRKVLLRLNPSEDGHGKLKAALDSLAAVGDYDVYMGKIDIALETAQTLLKREWEVTKYGSLAGVIGWLKSKVRSRASLQPPANKNINILANTGATAITSDHQPSVVEMAKVAITGLITTCSGVLIATFAFAHQMTDPSLQDRYLMLGSAGCAALSLWLALGSAIAGYFSEGFLVMSNPKPFFWWASVLAYLAAWLLLAAAFVCGGILLAWR